MFNRSIEGRLSTFDVDGNLRRFNWDEYLTKYLVGCYNPEFKIYMRFPKEIPLWSEYSVNYLRLRDNEIGGIF